MKTNKKALVICSGGLDSTVALYWAKTHYKRVEVLTYTYGQNHARREFAAINAVCKRAGIKLTRIKLDFIGKCFSSALLGGKIPEGNYNSKNMAATVVPFRNGIMLAVAAGLAESKKIDYIVLGNHAGDHFIYPDCRPEFIAATKQSINRGTKNHVEVLSPFCHNTKGEIVAKGIKLHVPLDMTYSCYKGGKIHCGTCGTCRERKEAFFEAGINDPTEYAK